MTKFVYFRLTAFLLFLMIMVGCSQGNGNEPSDQVTVQFSWFHTTEFAGFYAAAAQGYYAEENIDVTFVAGGPDVDPVAEVASGNAQFGTAPGDSIVEARAAGEEITAVAAIYRKSPLIVMTLADSGIERPQDLAGKTVGVISPNLDTNWDVQFLAMLNNLNIDPKSITFLPIENYHGAAEMTSGRLDAASSFFVTNEPVHAKMEGDEVVNMFYSDYGVQVYANPIFTSAALIEDNPDLVQRFVRATVRGYLFAVSNPETAVDATLAYDETLEREIEIGAMNVQIPFIDTGNAPVGYMDEPVWQSTQQMLLDQDIIDAPVDLNSLFTNQFVETIEQ